MFVWLTKYFIQSFCGLFSGLVQNQFLRFASGQQRLLNFAIRTKMIGLLIHCDKRMPISVSCFLHPGITAGVIRSNTPLPICLLRHASPLERRRRLQHISQTSAASLIARFQLIVRCFAQLPTIALAVPDHATAYALFRGIECRQLSEPLSGDIFCHLFAVLCSQASAAFLMFTEQFRCAGFDYVSTTTFTKPKIGTTFFLWKLNTHCDETKHIY